MAIYLKKRDIAQNGSESVDPIAPAPDEISATEKLNLLTDTFRSSLEPWKDADGNIKKIMIDGTEEILLYGAPYKVKEYAKEYTEIWKSQSEEMRKEMEHRWYINCQALYIEGWSKSPKEWAPVRFDHSVIHSCSLFSEQKFFDFASFRNVEFIGHAEFGSTNFEKKVNFKKAIFLNGANFSNGRFKDVASFEYVATSGGILNFSNALFKRAPVFHETKLPQGTSFDSTTFSINYRKLNQSEVEEEARAFRTLKQAAASYRGQQDEAEFFAREQNARRIAFLAPRLVWKDRPWRARFRLRHLRFSFSPVEWCISLLYNWISGYGRSPGRAISCFALTNLAALLVYLSFFNFGHCSDLDVNYCSTNVVLISSSPSPSPWYKALLPPVHLVVQNLLNPAGLVTEKALISVRHPLMLLISIIQFTSSYLILFLVALAVRTRFQKGSGGDR